MIRRLLQISCNCRRINTFTNCRLVSSPIFAMKYILVTGGVISGIGKGVIASSIGTILKHCGLHVTSIKIDPYINIDAGTFSPYEHGEVYVLDDGGEVDLDLGNYERFLDVTLHRDNNITTGKIYQLVINRERHGDYLGKTVQVVPHITDAIQEWVERVAKVPVTEDQAIPEVCIVELGGTIGDIEGMPFVEAFRQFQFRVKRENFCVIHVSLVPQPSTTGEHKTKPTQASVRELRGLGLAPDFIVCRSEKPVNDAVKIKISNFCHVSHEQVICLPDAHSIYSVPLMLEDQMLSFLLNERLNLNLEPVRPKNYMKKWREIAERHEHLRQSVTICLVGKYTQLEDSYASVTKALQHASLACNRRLVVKYVEAEDLEEEMKTSKPVKYYEAWQNVCKSNGIIVPGGFGQRGTEGKISVCKWARENKCPMLGICLGMQTAVVEFCRNVLHWTDANSQEMVPDGTRHVIIEMPEHNAGDMGGTMRLGRRKTLFLTTDSKLRKLYGNVDSVEERHRHRYEVNPEVKNEIESSGMRFVGQDLDGQRMEILELDDHPYYVGCQYHPEYLTRPLKPSPPYLGLILAACGKLDQFLSREYCPSPSESPVSSDEENTFAHHLKKMHLVQHEATGPSCSKSSCVTNSPGKRDATLVVKDFITPIEELQIVGE